MRVLKNEIGCFSDLNNGTASSWGSKATHTHSDLGNHSHSMVAGGLELTS